MPGSPAVVGPVSPRAATRALRTAGSVRTGFAAAGLAGAGFAAAGFRVTAFVFAVGAARCTLRLRSSSLLPSFFSLSVDTCRRDAHAGVLEIRFRPARLAA